MHASLAQLLSLLLPALTACLPRGTAQISAKGVEIEFDKAMGIVVKAGDLALSIFQERAKKFSSQANKDKYEHLNAKFLSSIPKNAKGIFAELAGVQEMSKATRSLLKTPTAALSLIAAQTVECSAVPGCVPTVASDWLGDKMTVDMGGSIADFNMEEFKDGLAGELGVMASDITLAFGEGPALQLRAKKAADDDEASFQVTTTIECPDRPTACDIGIKLQSLTADLTTLSEILKAEVKHADPPVLPSFCVVPAAVPAVDLPTPTPTPVATPTPAPSICDVIDCTPGPDPAPVTCDIVAEQLDGPCNAADGEPVCPISQHSVFIRNSRVAIGYNTGGQHGTHQPCSATAEFGTNFGKPCFGGYLGMMDPVPKSGDYFLPGARFESWAMGYRGTDFPSSRLHSAFPSTLTTPMSLVLTKGEGSAESKYTATSSDKKLHVQMTTTLSCSGTSGDFEYPLEVCLTNVALETLEDVYWSRTVDPDQGLQFGSTYTTTNSILMQDKDKGSIVRAYSSVAGASLVYSSFAPDTKAFIGLSFRPLTSAWYSMAPPPAAPAAGGHTVSDTAIGLFMQFGAMSPGETKCKTMTTRMGADSPITP